MPLDATNFTIPDSPVVRYLIAGMTRIGHPSDWCQRTGSRGNQRCSLSAMPWPSDSSYARAKDLLDEAAKRRGYTCIMHLNDESTHSKVMSAYQEAIENARAEALP